MEHTDEGLPSLEAIREALKQPENAQRSIPFWAWNDRLDNNELDAQARDMKEKGMGGMVVHSREGLETAYLSPQWMAAVKHSVDSARKLDLEIWLYDEDKWPSGSAGGKVAAEDEHNFTAMGLTAQLYHAVEDDVAARLSALGAENRAMYVYAIYDVDGELTELESFRRIEIAGEGPHSSITDAQALLVLGPQRSGSSQWYNNSAPSDNLNPQAVGRFIELTHEAYAAACSENFGTTVQGFFTDEPNFCDFFSTFEDGGPWLPWSSVLPQFFLEKRGYEIGEILPLLFFHGNGEKKARYDFWLTLTELFVSSYTRQLYLWCDRRGLKLTGHMLFENDLGYTVRVGGAAMPHYRYMHMPAIDILAMQTDEYLTVKQCTSVANQFGKPAVLSETYGCTGWNFSFADQKFLGEWQFVMGVTRRCQHLSLYSITGCRKRDYPPSFSYHNPWWQHIGELEDYFARLSLCVSSGEVQRDILLFHPIGDFWMESGSSMKEDLSSIEMNMGWLDANMLALNKKGDALNHLAKALLQRQFDFDFGDELLMKDAGAASDGRFRVAARQYTVVVLPGMHNLMASSVELLGNYLDSGGTLFIVEPVPEYIDGRPSDGLSKIINHRGTTVVPDNAALFSRLEKTLPHRLRVCDDYGFDDRNFMSMVRQVEHGLVISLLHGDRQSSRDVWLKFPVLGAVERYDPWTEERRELGVQLGDQGGMQCRVTFAPCQLLVFFLDTEHPPRMEDQPRLYRHPHRSEPVIFGFPRKTAIELTMENALVLDTCRLRLGDKAWWDEQPVWTAQRELREQLGMPPVYYNGAPQRYSWLGQDMGTTYPVTMSFLFHVQELPQGELFAAIEKSSQFDVTCNAVSCPPTDRRFLDRQINCFSIAGLREGDNTIELRFDYHRGMELEDMFIVGNFGVTPERCICSLPRELEVGDWCLQGLKHYGGGVRYRYGFPDFPDADPHAQLFLRLGKFHGSVARIFLNGECAGQVFDGNVPFPLGNLGKLLQDNMLTVEVVGGLRNLLGPFHRSYENCSRISWQDFRTEGAEYSPEYSLVQQGLSMAPVLLFLE